jgi:hypothetical protein
VNDGLGTAAERQDVRRPRNARENKMLRRSYFRLIGLLVGLMLCSCEDSDNCPCSPGRIDPPVSDLLVTWDRGFIAASLMPIVPPDPVICGAWLILENKNSQEAFSKVWVPTADVILAGNDSTLGTIPIETDWDGLLAPGKRDTIFFFKYAGNQTIFSPPCGEQVFVDFMIQNADGDTKVFRPDTLTFMCAF